MKISFTESNRNGGVLNMSSSGSTPLSITTIINIDPLIGCNDYPQLLVPPVDRACSGVTFFHSPGAFDADGDSLSYELVTPQPAQQYKDPNDAEFYMPGQPLNEKGNGPAVFSIDPISGLLILDAPGVQGEYNIAIKITEWRRVSCGEPIMLSSIIRDMQIVVEDCNNNRPDLIIPKDTCIQAGDPLNAVILGTDKDGNAVKIETYSEVFELTPDNLPATYSPNPSVYTSSNPPAQLTFQWNTNCLHVRKTPYQVIFKITDDPPSGPRLVTYKAWTIKVVAPKPVLQNLTPDFVNRYALLSWDQYNCSDAEAIQIWRRVDSYDYTSSICDAINLQSLGYELIQEVSTDQVQFLDTNAGKGLSVGAKYCYRMIARLSDCNFSPVSDELCMDPIVVDAPVITHVTVNKTDTENGAIRISWRSPFEINKVQFPEPYHYYLYRGEGLDHSGPVMLVGQVSDTTFLDAGINTEEKVYHYTILLSSKTQNNPTYSFVDTSATASSIQLITSPQEKAIQLGWAANVPWSNISQRFSRHLIYRNEYGFPESSLTLIDSVDVTQEGFNYLDVGKYLNRPIDDNTFYCYKVLTRGVYGNPAIKEPLENLSPLICSYPINDLPICSPVVMVVKNDCDAFLSESTCGPYNLSNTIFWKPPVESGCRVDIKSYSVYASNSTDGEFELIASNVRDTFFIESNLTSQARCYKLKTVDKLGRESELSDPACGDNCTFFELPNVFTPNGDGCNDTFSAYYQEKNDGEEAPCQVLALQRCPRFVNRVYFKVYNRWGQKVYYNSYEGNTQSIAINWNGRTNNGVELASSVYYYTAEVEFDTIDASKKKKRLNGWVQLLR